MTGTEIEKYARDAVATSGDPAADPGPLIMALRNAAARERALADPFWRDLANQEADRMKMEGQGDVEAAAV